MSGLLEGPQWDEAELAPVAVTVRFRVAEDSLVFKAAWVGGVEVGDEDSWSAQSWLEEHEGEVLEQVAVILGE